MIYVLDASVAAKWFLSPKDEELTAEALGLLRKYSQREVSFMIPDLFWVEIASVFRKAIRLARFDEGSARNAFTYLENCDLPAYSSTVLFHRAFEIAMRHNQSIYDSMYVALAVQTESQLITADERLANSLAARFPVKWLGVSFS
jgi:predicted nucleic acid-binding protein